ncbi:MAG: hypothetical protein FIA82_12310 [Melioribacter sp.]|nr:hypothetical protein [Melioribacter sp.]
MSWFSIFIVLGFFGRQIY